METNKVTQVISLILELFYSSLFSIADNKAEWRAIRKALEVIWTWVGNSGSAAGHDKILVAL